MSWRTKFIVFILLLIVAVLPRNADPALLKTRGLWVQFEQRGVSVQYWPGQVIQLFNTFDSVLGHNVSDEVALQLDKMRGMGVNTITIELRSADQDGTNVFPICHVHPALGFQWPQPTTTELANIVPFFDLIHSKGFKVILVLVNMHMDEPLPRTNSQTWLGAILNAVKNHPALDFVVFNGDANTVDTNGDGSPDACGIEAEAPLWLGATAYAGTYVQWAIGYALNSLGMPASKLSSGEVIGDYFTDSGAACGQVCTGGHLWKTYVVMKTIFDNLSIPANQRVYALSFYEHRKCLTARFLQCTEADPPTWADQTMQNVYNAIGSDIGARVVAYEMGNNSPIDPTYPNWTTANALANLVAVLKKYGADGGSFYRWVNFQTSDDTNPTVPQPIKLRGVAFNYTATKTALVQAYKPPAHDLNGDGTSDLLWYNSASGQLVTWLLNGTSLIGGGSPGSAPNPWTVVGQRDFNGDGFADVLWRNSSSGQMAVWLLNGTAVIGGGSLGAVANPWTVAGTGDFNGDGLGDVLWYNASSGQLLVWLLNGTSVIGGGSPGSASAPWTVAGTGDFNGDGMTDILWYNTSTGQALIWLLNGASVIGGGSPGAAASPWGIAGTGDFNGDGNYDLLWRNTSTGQVVVWLLNGASVLGGGSLGSVPSPWTPVQTGDFNGDGMSDILWSNGSSGQLLIWFMNGAAAIGGGSPGGATSPWQLQLQGSE